MNASTHRPLLDHERMLLRRLAPAFPFEGALVCDRNDDGMGGIVFIGRPGIAMQAARRCQFVDIDGLPVVVELLEWEDGRVAELDFWKVDDSAVERFPQTESEITELCVINLH